MAIIRQKRKKRFSIIDNRVIEDGRLSWGARGLLEYMLSKPDDWKFYMSELISHSDKDGRDKTYGYINELKKYGYVTRKQKRNSSGKFGNQDLIVTDSPLTGFPDTVKPDTDKPDTANPQLLNTEYKPNTDLNNTDEPLTDDHHSLQDVFNLWQQSWGFPNGIAQQDLTEWSNEFGADLLYYCVEYALRRNISSKGADRYLYKKLNAYKEQGIKTVAGAKKDDERHEQQMNREYQGKRRGYGDPQVRETLPDWFGKDYSKPSKSTYQAPDDSQDVMPDD
ncbi:MAG: DnaD domain protein [Limosilactobacillus sp.]